MGSQVDVKARKGHVPAWQRERHIDFRLQISDCRSLQRSARCISGRWRIGTGFHLRFLFRRGGIRDRWGRRLRAEKLLHGGDQIRAAVFGNHFSHAGGCSFVLKRLRPVHGIEKNWGMREVLQDFARRSQPVHDWHGEVEDDDLRVEFESFANRVVPVFRLEKLDGLRAPEQLVEHNANTPIVVRNQDSGRHAS